MEGIMNEMLMCRGISMRRDLAENRLLLSVFRREAQEAMREGFHGHRSGPGGSHVRVDEHGSMLKHATAGTHWMETPANQDIHSD